MRKSTDDPHELYKKIQSLTNAGGKALVEKDPVNFLVPLRVDNSVSPGKFKPDPLVPRGYIASKVTLRALKSELLLASEFADTENLVKCTSCRQDWDRQFWHFCPICEKDFT